MKKTTLLIIALILICSGNMGRKEAVANDNTTNATIRIASTPDLYKLADKWSNEYGRLNPGINIDVIQVTETGIPGIFQDGTNIGFVSSQYFRALDAQSIWQVVVGRDVIVPVINSNNPLLDQINEKGISAEAFAQLIINPDRSDWGTLFNNGQDIPVHYYMVNDESIKSGMLNFLKIDQTAIHGNMLENKQEMISLCSGVLQDNRHY